MKKAVNIDGHVLLLKHTKLNEKDSENLIKKYNIKKEQLPVIFLKDPAIKEMKEVVPGDVIEISRSSPTTGSVKYYRVVINA